MIYFLYNYKDERKNLYQCSAKYQCDIIRLLRLHINNDIIYIYA